MTTVSPQIFFTFHGRFPSEKAASLFTAKCVESYNKLGIRTRLLVPMRFGSVRSSALSYYGLEHDLCIVQLPTIDLFSLPLPRRFVFGLSLFTFSLSTFVYLLFFARRTDIVYSWDALTIAICSIFFHNTCYEMHEYPDSFPFHYRRVLDKVSCLVITNHQKSRKFIESFPLFAHKVVTALHGVSVESFTNALSKEEARERLALPAEGLIVVYTGHLLKEKGVDILAESASDLPSFISIYVVGGTEEDIRNYKSAHGSIKNLHVIGQRPYQEMPLWQSAADVLVLPNTRDDITPMKLFEYMASGKPIVTVEIPAVLEVLAKDMGFFAQRGDAKSLASAIEQAIREGISQGVAIRMKEKVKEYTWETRAKNIFSALLSKTGYAI